MKKLSSILSCLCLATFLLPAQVRGIVLEEDSGQPVIQAAVQLLSPRDSVQVLGTVTDNDGNFSLNAAPGEYVARISYIGFVTQARNIRVSRTGGEVDMGRILLSPDALLLESSVVTATAQLMTSVADTIVYNPAALIVEDDAMLEDLLKKIPGLEVDENGNVSLNGRQISRLMVNGQTFFGTSVSAGLKSLPAEMIENIRAYERQSDYARITGVDDGESEPVLDVRIKPAFMRNWNNRLTLGGGTSGRYSGRFNGNRIDEHGQATLVASANNVTNPNPYNSKSNQLGTGSSGDVDRGELGFNLSRKDSRSDLGGSAHYDWNLRDASSSAQTENVYTSSSNYGFSQSKVNSQKHNLKLNGNFEWKPVKNWNILLKPVLTYSRSDSRSSSDSRTLNASELLLYSAQTSNRTIQDRLNANLSFQVHHRFNDHGMSATLRSYVEYIWSGDDVTNDNNTRYWQIKSNPDSLRRLGYWQLTRLHGLNTNTWVTWNQPLAKNMFLQLQYRFQYKRLSNAKESFTTLEDIYFDPGQSGRAKYDFFGHYLLINYRYIKKKFNLTAGVLLVPQHTRLHYPDGASRDTSTFVFSAAPNLNIRYNKSKEEQLSLTYTSFAGQPWSGYLLAAPVSTSPTYIRYGNPGLLPSYTHNMNLTYNLTDKKRQSSLVCNAGAKVIERAVSLSSEYDPETGGRVARPKNIDGNWNADASVVYNQIFGKSGFSLSSNTKLEFTNNVNYLYNSKTKSDEINTIIRAMAIERFNCTYRNKWIELTANLAGQYTLENSFYRPSMNQHPWSVSAGVSAVFRAPWKMMLTTDFGDWIQRGYLFEELNRDYLIWNARLSQSFLKGALTLSIDWKDILRQQENLVRTFTAERRSITTYNGVNSYIIFQLSYRFKSE